MADVFNALFVKKIADLKESIYPNQTRDPLEKIREKMKNKNLSLKLKQVTPAIIAKVMKKMNKKKSKGNDGIPQDCLLLGQEVIAVPLANVINASIESGVFPEPWKEAIVIPNIKKVTLKTQKITDRLAAFWQQVRSLKKWCVIS